MENQVLLFISTLTLGNALSFLKLNEKLIKILCVFPILCFFLINFEHFNILNTYLLPLTILFTLIDIIKEEKLLLVEVVCIPWLIYYGLNSSGILNFLFILFAFQQLIFLISKTKHLDDNYQKLIKLSFYKTLFSTLLVAISVLSTNLAMDNIKISAIVLLSFIYVGNFIGSFRLLELYSGKGILKNAVIFLLFPIIIFVQFLENFNLNLTYVGIDIFTIFIFITAFYIVQYFRVRTKKHYFSTLLYVANTLAIFIIYLLNHNLLSEVDLVFVLVINYLMFFSISQLRNKRIIDGILIFSVCLPLSPLFIFKWYYLKDFENIYLLSFLMFCLIPFFVLKDLRLSKGDKHEI